MTKAEIVDEIVENTGIERVKVQSIVEGFMECVIKSLSEGENVYFHDFGSFMVKTRAKRNSRDISRAKTVVVPDGFMVDANKEFTFTFKLYEDEAEHTIEECKERDITYEAPLRVKVRLFDENNNKWNSRWYFG